MSSPVTLDACLIFTEKMFLDPYAKLHEAQGYLDDTIRKLIKLLHVYVRSKPRVRVSQDYKKYSDILCAQIVLKNYVCQ